MSSLNGLSILEAVHMGGPFTYRHSPHQFGHHKHPDRYEAAWLEACEAVRSERKKVEPNCKEIIADLVDAMNETDLRDLLKRLPPAAVWRAWEEHTT